MRRPTRRCPLVIALTSAILATSLAACSGGPATSPAKQGTVVPVATHPPDPTPKPSVTPTPVPAATPVPTPAGGPTPLPTRPIALPGPARFDPLPDARGAIAVSTTGGGFGLLFPDTGALVPIDTLVPSSGMQVRGPDSGLAWSPDGTRIAFVCPGYGPPQDQQIGYLMLADLERGEVRSLRADAGVYGRPAWSPDGTRLAYVRSDGRGQLSVLDAASGAARTIADDAVFAYWRAPVWLDDGHVAYTRTAGPNGTQAELVSLALDGSAPQVIAQSARLFALSPDGARVAYFGGSQVCVRDIAAGSERCFAGLLEVQALQWSPDGASILTHASPAGILLGRADASEALAAIPATGVPRAQAWSADGRRLAFIAGGDKGARPALAIYDIEGRALSTLSVTVDIPFEVVWSPQ